MDLWGVVQSTYAQTTFVPGKTPCFNCLLPHLPSINLTCDTVGVIQPAVTMTTSFQIADALKILTHQATDIKLKYGDVWEGYHHAIGFKICKMTHVLPADNHLLILI